ncbi:MAG: hypothetical protein WC760_07660 [Bacteroidia bacterium]|jgi:hypothetical protein
MKSSEEEITLRELGIFIQNLFSSLISIVVAGIGLIRRKILLFILLVLAGGVAGWYVTHKQEPYYESGITCTFNDLHKKTYGEMIVLLNTYIQQGQTDVLKEELQVTQEAAQSLIYIHAANILGSPLQDDFTTERLPFYLKIGQRQPEYAQEIHEGILRYLQANSYSASRRKVSLENAWNKINYVNQQICMLDSIKRAYRYALLQDKLSGIQQVEIHPERVFKESDSLFNVMQEANWVLKIDNSVEKIYEQRPTQIITPVQTTRNATLGAGAGILLFLCIALFSKSSKEPE